MYREVNVNCSLVELLEMMNTENAVEVIRVIRVVYGVTYKRIAEIMGISRSSLAIAVSHGCFDSLVCDEKLNLGIQELRQVYLDKA